MLDIERDWRKTLKKETEEGKTRKSQTTTTTVFTFTFLHRQNCFHVACYWKCSNKTPTPIQIWLGFADTARRTKIHDNGPDILS